MAIGDHTPRTYKPGDMAYVRLALTDPAGIDRTFVELNQVGGGGGFALSSPNTLYKETAREVIVSGTISKTVPPGDYETTEAITRDRLGNRSVRTLSPPLKITVEEGLQDTEGPDVSGWGFAGSPFLERPRSAAMVSVKDYGAQGDGVTDDSAAFQAAIDAVFNAGGGMVSAPGRYRLAGPITVRSNVQLVGQESVQEVLTTGVPETIKMSDLRTSVLLIDHGAGAGAGTSPAITLRGDSPVVKGLLIYYVGQVKPAALWKADIPKNIGDKVQPTDPAAVGLFEASAITGTGRTGTTEPTWPTTDGATAPDNEVTWTRIGTQTKTPIAYPPTISLYATEHVRHPQVIDCFIPNAYHAVKFETVHARSRVERCVIGAYLRGITIDRAPSKCRVSDIYMPIAYNYVEGLDLGTSLDNFVKTNMVALELGAAEWADINQFFVYQCAIGVRFVIGTRHNNERRGPQGVAVNIGIDACNAGIDSRGTAGAGFDVFGFECYAEHGASPRALKVAGATVDAVPHASRLRLFGGRMSGSATMAGNVSITAGSLMATGVDFFSNPVDAGVHYFNGAEFMRLSGCRWNNGGAGLVIDSASSGRVILDGNDLGAATYTPPATLPSGGYKAGLNFGIPTANM